MESVNRSLFSRFLLYCSRQGWVKRLKSRYPAVYQWLISRFDPTHFFGLPLLIILSLLLANGMIFSEIAEDVVNSESMVQIDQEVTLFLFARRSQPLSQFLLAMSEFGSQGVSIGMTVVVGLALLWKRLRWQTLSISLVMIGVGLSIHYGKLVFQRVRPLDVAYYQETNFSFPSGHSATVMGLYGWLAYFLIRRISRFRARLAIGFLAVLLVLLVGFSRIYLGVHFLSDVLGGYLVGATWLIVGISIIEWQRFRQQVVRHDSFLQKEDTSEVK